MKRKLKIAVPFVVVVAGLVIGYAMAMHPRNSFWDELNRSIRNGESTIYIRDLVPFEWESVCVLEPYSLGVGDIREARAKEYIQGNLGRFRYELPDLNDDGSWAFVFIEEGNVSHIAERGRGYFIHRSYEDNCLSREHAKFTVKGSNIYIKE